MNAMLKKLSKFIFPLLIILLTALLAYLNYVPGTILSGWDTLHPEFNFGLYLKRIFFGVWQEHQGLGAVAAQAQMAELTRIPFVYLLNLILPMEMVRYVFFFICYGVGGIGTYLLSKYLISQDRSEHSGSASFLGSVFYLLNLATLQHFYVPLEMFAVHFATLPFLIFFAIKYFREGKKKNILSFSIVTLLATSMAHTATLFYAYLLVFGLFVLFVILLKRKWITVKRGVVLILLTLSLNLFWLAPNVYYILKHNREVGNSKIHQVFSDEAFLQSKSYGNIKDLGLLKNFLFSWRNYSFEDGKFVDLMGVWKDHLGNPGVKEIGYGMSVVVLLGVLVSLFRKSKYALALLPLLLVGVFFWINENPPFTFIFESLRSRYGIFREALRFPFTKFSIVLISAMSVYFAFGMNFILAKLSKLRLGYVIIPILLGMNVYFMLPAFTGNLISPAMKVNLPDEYYSMFEYFKGQNPDLRVAKFPLNSMWGWNFYEWGYEGAGFTWFGIGQPTLDREFDRWGKDNESFYRELSYAYFDGNLPLFEQVLAKYDVGFLLLDENTLNAGGEEKLLGYDKLKEFLAKSSNIKGEKSFGKLSVYRTGYEAKYGNLGTVGTAMKTDADLTYFDIDNVYLNNGNYFTGMDGVSFPFANLDPRMGIKVSFEEENIRLEKDGYSLTVPKKLLSREDLSVKRGFAEAINGDLGKLGTVSKEYVPEGITYKASGGGAAIDFLEYLNLPQKDAYLMRIQGRNVTGRSLKIYLYNPTSGRMELEELMPPGNFEQVFTILPKSEEAQGYVLNLETRSYGGVSSENILTGVEVYELPFGFVTNLHFGPKAEAQVMGDLKIIEAKKVNPSLYRVKVEGKGILSLSQAYEDGWIALPKGKYEPLTHVKINSWKNGWVVTGPGEYIILFWPQGLEYLGFLGIIPLLLIASRRPKKA
jgi:hypothetical protein